ncbi:MAG TPA: MOSC and FAD-binding oxidoreductase domain-containing protein [Puia sp.]|nr:MOSC and FAD-binding oxidoreductase domain-containing protein [Puia sp.]
MKILSVNISLPREIEFRGQKVRTSIFKMPVDRRVMARRMNLDGDTQSDLMAHGGEHRAVFVYQSESYEYWKRVLQRDDLHYGQFGENFTVEGLADKDVCIGDRYRIGSAIFEVTQPRVTCYKVGISLGVPEMPALLVAHKRPGFYFRVIEEGEIGAGDPIQKLSSGTEGMSVADMDQLLYSKDHPMGSLIKALKIPALSKGWQWSLNELLNAARGGVVSGNAGLAGPEARPLAWVGFRRFVIKRAFMESTDVRSFELTPGDGGALAPFQAGQHLAVRIRSLADGQTLIRMYSLCGPQGGDSYRIAVKREISGRGSGWLHERFKEGDVVEISAPRGGFVLLPAEEPVVLLAAGVGITPLLAMLYALKNESTARKVWWIYATQNLEHHCFLKEIMQIASELKTLRVVNIYSRPDAAAVLGVDYDIRGHLSLDVLKQLGVPVEADFYLCGPGGYLTGTIAALKALGIAEGRIRFESFGQPGQVSSSGKVPHLPAENDGTGPLVTFTKSNVSFAWSPRFGSILEAAEACDVPVSWSCRTGVCHRCESALLEGKVEYSPEPLDPAGEGNILICCSRPVSGVVLDL